MTTFMIIMHLSYENQSEDAYNVILDKTNMYLLMTSSIFKISYNFGTPYIDLKPLGMNFKVKNVCKNKYFSGLFQKKI